MAEVRSCLSSITNQQNASIEAFFVFDANIPAALRVSSKTTFRCDLDMLIKPPKSSILPELLHENWTFLN
jgi:hypothetical protein